MRQKLDQQKGRQPRARGTSAKRRSDFHLRVRNTRTREKLQAGAEGRSDCTEAPEVKSAGRREKSSWTKRNGRGSLAPAKPGRTGLRKLYSQRSRRRKRRQRERSAADGTKSCRERRRRISPYFGLTHMNNFGSIHHSNLGYLRRRAWHMNTTKTQPNDHNCQEEKSEGSNREKVQGRAVARQERRRKQSRRRHRERAGRT